MMKKMTSMLLALTMVFGIVQTTFAGSVKEDIQQNVMTLDGGVEYELSNGLLVRKEAIKVPTDIKVRFDGGTYENNVSKELSSADATETVDFEAKMDMSGVKEVYDLYIARAKSLAVSATPATGYATPADEIDATTVTGKFTVKINLPATNFTLPANWADDNKDMNGWDNTVAGVTNGVFVETKRELADNTITIEIALNSGVTAAKLGEAGSLVDLVLRCNGVVAGKGTHTIGGSVEGEITIGDIGKLSFVATDPVSKGAVEPAVVTLTYSEGGTTMGGGTPTVKAPEFDFVVNGEKEDDVTVPSSAVTTEGSKVTIDFDKVTIKGHEILGWYLDEEMTKPVEGKYTFTKKTTFYVDTKPVEVETPDINVDGDRFAYIIGYTDGTVRPENNISRQEVATIFFRILTEESREANLTEENNFTDVDSARWSNKAISTMAAMGVVNGYTDGTFKPEADITRAEFATMAARFIKSEVVAENRFTDVAGHWAEEYITKAAYAGWVEGNESGTFRPDDYITRAEVMAIVNRVLKTDKSDDVVSELDPNWIDNPKSAWYYKDVVVATSDFAWDEEYEK